jgi:hypothetical protein
MQGPVLMDPTGKSFYVEPPVRNQILAEITNKFGGSASWLNQYHFEYLAAGIAQFGFQRISTTWQKTVK